MNLGGDENYKYVLVDFDGYISCSMIGVWDLYWCFVN